MSTYTHKVDASKLADVLRLFNLLVQPKDSGLDNYDTIEITGEDFVVTLDVKMISRR